MKLVLPAAKYKESFIKAVLEYKKEKGKDSLKYVDLNIDVISQDFSAFISSELEKSEGKSLPAGYVPQTTFWLVDEGEYIGRVSIRHELTESLLKLGGHIGYDIRPSKRGRGYGKKILELGLSKAKQRGITKVLITCDLDNLASKKIIKENGGVFEDSIQIEQRKSRTLRYWINIK